LRAKGGVGRGGAVKFKFGADRSRGHFHILWAHHQHAMCRVERASERHTYFNTYTYQPPHLMAAILKNARSPLVALSCAALKFIISIGQRVSRLSCAAPCSRPPLLTRVCDFVIDIRTPGQEKISLLPDVIRVDYYVRRQIQIFCAATRN
jgi:hypothetical protein